MPGISIHVVDVTRGEPARGMAVDVFALDPAGGQRVRAGGGAVGDAGTIDDAALARGDAIRAGLFEVELHAGAYYRALGVATARPAFQETVVFRFGLADASEHVHLPIKLSPWGLSIWRGR
jgi:5-hydroxyisourate hydrolase